MLEPNSSFGEIAILCDTPQPYTVRVCDLCRLLRIDKQHFANILQIYFVDGRTVLSNLLEVFLIEIVTLSFSCTPLITFSFHYCHFLFYFYDGYHVGAFLIDMISLLHHRVMNPMFASSNLNLMSHSTLESKKLSLH